MKYMFVFPHATHTHTAYTQTWSDRDTKVTCQLNFFRCLFTGELIRKNMLCKKVEMHNGRVLCVCACVYTYKHIHIHTHTRARALRGWTWQMTMYPENTQQHKVLLFVSNDSLRILGMCEMLQLLPGQPECGPALGIITSLPSWCNSCSALFSSRRQMFVSGYRCIWPARYILHRL